MSVLIADEAAGAYSQRIENFQQHMKSRLRKHPEVVLYCDEYSDGRGHRFRAYDTSGRFDPKNGIDEIEA